MAFSLPDNLPRPSPRTLIVGGVAFAVLVAAVLGLWWWSSMKESAALAAYAGAMTEAQAATGPEATPAARTAAIAELERVLARYPSAGPAAPAALELGHLRYAEHRYDGARAAYAIAAGRATSPTIRTLARAGIGYAWEAERNLPRAIEAYRQALDGVGPSDFLYEELMLDLARVQEASGQKPAAIETYRKLLADRPGSPRADAVRSRLAALGATP